MPDILSGINTQNLVVTWTDGPTETRLAEPAARKPKTNTATLRFDTIIFNLSVVQQATLKEVDGVVPRLFKPGATILIYPDHDTDGHYVRVRPH